MHCEANLSTTSDDAIVAHAISILEKRVALPIERVKPFTLASSDEGFEAVKQYLALNMGNFDVEHMHALYFEPSGKLIRSLEISKGDEKTVGAYPREICRQGLLCNATYVVIAHNHPNGDARPSPQDANAALHTAEACELVGLQLAYAFVVAGPSADKVVPVPPPHDSKGIEDVLSHIFG